MPTFGYNVEDDDGSSALKDYIRGAKVSPASSGTLNKLYARIQRWNYDTNMTAFLWKDSDKSLIATSDEVVADTNGNSWYEFTFDGESIVKDTDYILTVSADSSSGVCELLYKTVTDFGYYYQSVTYSRTPSDPWSSATWTTAYDRQFAIYVDYTASGGGTGHTATPADTQTIADATPKLDIGINLSDTLGIADSFTKDSEFFRTPADTIGITDSFTKDSEFFRTLSDTQTIADVVSNEPDIILGDTLTLADIFTKDSEFFISPSDTIAIVDNISTQHTDLPEHNLALSDTLTISDNFTKESEFERSLVDTLTLADILALEVTLPIDDTVAIADNIVNEPELILDDTLSIADVFSKESEFYRILDDTVTILDSYDDDTPEVVIIGVKNMNLSDNLIEL